MINMTDIDGHTLTLTYTDGKLSEVKDHSGRTLTLSYHNGRLDQVTDSTGRFTKYGYDGAGDLIEYRDAECKLWQYRYYVKRAGNHL